jgi:DNA polymerase
MIVAIDFETAYSREYSLRRMTEVEYILSPLYETLMCAIKLGDGPSQVYVGDANIRAAFAQIDWGSVAVLSHNTRFDGAILAWRFGIIPRLYLDTLSMARAMTHPYVGSSSLDAVAKHMGLPPKGTEIVAGMGKWLADFSPGELEAYVNYCAHDNNLCYTIFQRFREAGFPSSELALIDLSLRMFIDPQVTLNAVKLAEYLNHVRAQTAALFGEFSTIDKSVFSSNQQFAALLEQHGVTVPKKISPTTGELTWALAKGDWAFKELCADATQPLHVQALLATRLHVKSTIEETRTASLLKLSQREWPAAEPARRGFGGSAQDPPSNSSGWMPAPYRYYGAHTGRFSGDGGVNFANLTRGSPIRDAIEAPPGFRVVHRDASQIEARMVAWLAGCDTLTTAFAEGRDVYSEFASRFYRRTVTRDDVKERFAGKTAILSLGYGCGHARFRHALFIGQGGVSVNLSLHDADALVTFYRDTFREIPALWWRAGNMLRDMMAQPGNDRVIEFEPIPVVKYDTDVVWLPNGLSIQYPHLRWRADEVTGKAEIVYDAPQAGIKRLYGAKLIENICQSLARIVVTDTALRVYHQTGFRPFMGTYDSWDYLCPEDGVAAFDELLAHEFTICPSWAEGLPLASEGGWGRTLLEAERGVNQ